MTATASAGPSAAPAPSAASSPARRATGRPCGGCTSSRPPRSSPTNGRRRGCAAPRGRRCRPWRRNMRSETGRGASAPPGSSGYARGTAPGRRNAAGSPTAPRSTCVAEWITGPVGSSCTTVGFAAHQHDDRPPHGQSGQRFVGGVQQQHPAPPPDASRRGRTAADGCRRCAGRATAHAVPRARISPPRLRGAGGRGSLALRHTSSDRQSTMDSRSIARQFCSCSQVSPVNIR